MDSFLPICFDIFEIYSKYCEITSGRNVSGNGGYTLDDESPKGRFSTEALTQLSKDSRMQPRTSFLEEIYRMMARLDLKVDFSEFSRFYDFVFFICRENGQKNITVHKAVMAWRLVLSGRFRLLNEWCSFVEKNQRHNISEDTWRQVLAFSRCVHENLEGYDPQGAWPVLIDDFVEHMYRTRGSNSSSNLICNCGDSEASSCDDSLPGLKAYSGLKRKSSVGKNLESLNGDSGNNYITNFKRRNTDLAGKTVKHGEDPQGSVAKDGMEMVRQNSSFGSSKSPCAVEGCISKGFAGLLTSHSGLKIDQERRSASYT